MTVITLTTDFGTRDGNVGVMKGVIWGIAPGANITDISHDITPQNIHQATFVLGRHVYYFPENTVHIVVVDPGVGTERRPIAAQIGSHFYVGPDNGVFTPMYLRAEKEGWPMKIIHTVNPEYWRQEISHVFHGRDIFAPVGAHLTAGVPLNTLGEQIHDPVRIHLPQPQRTDSGVIGEVIHIDRFGNIFSNIQRDELVDLGDVEVSMRGAIINGLVQTFGERDPGELIALYSSTDDLIVAEVNGNAGKRLNAKVGDEIKVVAKQ